MPTNNRLRLDKDQCAPPAGPQPLQHNPEKSIRSGKSRPRILPLQNAELLPQRQVLQDQIAAGAKTSSKEND
jgi:hypothetical protein